MGLNTARVNLASDLGRAREIKNRIERKRRELSEKEAIAETGEREREETSIHRFSDVSKTTNLDISLVISVTGGLGRIYSVL